MLEDDPEYAMGIAGPAGWILVSAALMATSGVWGSLFRRRPAMADRVAASILGLGAAVGLIAAVAGVLARRTPSVAWAWTLPWGRFSVAIDGLSAAFLFPVLVIPALAGVYGVESWSERSQPRNAPRVRIFLGLLAGAMTMLIVARDAVLFLMAFEVMTLAAFVLVTTEHEKSEAREAGWLYLASSHFSFILLMGVFAGLRGVGGTFELNALPAGATGTLAGGVIFLAALAAFGVKAGIMPFHIWLPPAHAAAPSHVSAVLSGVVIKTGVYGIMRVLAMLPDAPVAWGVLLLVLGAVSGVGGVAFALGQHDLKRLLAYHSIENIGIIVMGLGLAVVGRWAGQPLLVVLGFGGAVLHVWNHALFKSLLFLSAGVVVHESGTREMDRLGGLARRLPWTAALFTLGAVAICGLPPLNGFVSEFILYVGSLRGLERQGVWPVALIAPVLALIGALACACFAKVIGTVFLGLPRDERLPGGHECGWWMRCPMLVLALLCVGLGVAPILAARGMDAATSAWMGAGAADLPSLASAVAFGPISVAAMGVAAAAGAVFVLLRRAARGPRTIGTWDCGYARPTPRMQYTGSSFAGGLVSLFRFVLRPREQIPAIRGAMPVRTGYRGHVDDVVLQRWILPSIRRGADWCLRIRHRWSPRIQTYIAYVVAAALLLLLLNVPIIEMFRRFLTK